MQWTTKRLFFVGLMLAAVGSLLTPGALFGEPGSNIALSIVTDVLFVGGVALMVGAVWRWWRQKRRANSG